MVNFVVEKVLGITSRGKQELKFGFKMLQDAGVFSNSGSTSSGFGKRTRRGTMRECSGSCKAGVRTTTGHQFGPVQNAKKEGRGRAYFGEIFILSLMIGTCSGQIC